MCISWQAIVWLGHDEIAPSTVWCWRSICHGCWWSVKKETGCWGDFFIFQLAPQQFVMGLKFPSTLDNINCSSPRWKVNYETICKLNKAYSVMVQFHFSDICMNFLVSEWGINLHHTAYLIYILKCRDCQD